MDDNLLVQPDTPPGPAPGRILATPGPAEKLARALDLGEPTVVVAGAEVLSAARGGEAAAAVVNEALPDMTAVELARRLRAGRLGAGLPLLVVTEAYTDEAEEAALAAGADEYVDAAALGPRLLRRLRGRLRRAWEREQASPLTGLPGRGRLEQELAQRWPQAGELAVVALDVRHFKAFNDRYGYRRGDQLLLLVRDVGLEVLERRGEPSDLLVHLGGDDFFLLTHPGRAEALVAPLREEFARRVGALYDATDRQAGGVAGPDRDGGSQGVALASLLAVGMVNGGGAPAHWGELGEALAALKERARRAENNQVVWAAQRGKGER